MKTGDLVRFRTNASMEESGTWFVGLLIEYHKWEKIATILYDDKLYRVSARNTQKYGKRYLEY